MCCKSSGLTGWGRRGRVSADSFRQEIFADLPWEKRGHDKREKAEEKKDNCLREGGKFEMEGEKV